MNRRLVTLLVLPLLALGMMGAENPACQGAHGGHPAPTAQQPAPKADPNPHRSDQIKKTYLFRIEVTQIVPTDIYVSHQIGAYRELEEHTSEISWWTEARLVPGDKLWVHVVKPRGKGFITCHILYYPDNRTLRFKVRRSRDIWGPGTCDAVYYVTHREEYE